MTSDLAGARILVTGAAGFIGFHCAGALLAAGAEVVGMDNLNAYYDPALKEARVELLSRHSRFALHRQDLAAPGAAAAIAALRADYVLHLAAQAGVRYSLTDPAAYLKSNMDGFLSVLEACRAAPPKHLVYASSSSVYGLNAALPFSEHAGADHPLSLYAATKRANELMAHTYAHLFGLPSSGLRFFTVYGPWGRPDMAYWRFTRAILAGETVELYAAAEMQRDLTYVDDVVAAILRLLPLAPAGDPGFDATRPDPASSTAPYRVLNIGNHTPVPLPELLATIEQACGRRANVVHKPRQPGDGLRTWAAVDDLAALTGFAPRTRLADGMARFVAWYRAHHGA